MRHEGIESKGKMIVEGERFETVVQVYREDPEEEPTKKSFLPIEIVKKGDRYIVEKRA